MIDEEQSCLMHQSIGNKILTAWSNSHLTYVAMSIWHVARSAALLPKSPLMSAAYMAVALLVPTSTSPCLIVGIWPKS